MKIMIFRYVVLCLIVLPIFLPGICGLVKYWLGMNAELPVRKKVLTEDIRICLDSNRHIVLPKGLVLRSLDKTETDPLYPDTETYKIYIHVRGMKLESLENVAVDTNLIHKVFLPDAKESFK